MYDSNEQHHNSLGKIFRIAVFSFSGVVGVALWALIGQPVSVHWTPKISATVAPVEHLLGSAVESVGDIKTKLTPKDHSPFTLALTTPADDLPRMRRVFENAKLVGDARMMTFYINSHVASGAELLAHMSNVEMSTDLAYGFGDVESQYSYIENTARGNLRITILDRAHAYAALVKNENHMLTGMLTLSRPYMSPSEIRMHVKSGSEVVPHSDGVSERVLRDASGNTLLSWKLTKDELVIAAQ